MGHESHLIREHYCVRKLFGDGPNQASNGKAEEGEDVTLQVSPVRGERDRGDEVW